MGRCIEVKLLPDGSGQVRVHWLHVKPDGPIETPTGFVMGSRGPVRLDGGAPRSRACRNSPS